MVRTATTFTKTAEGKVLYHFICNHCGMRNDKVAQISADAQATYSGAAYGNMAGSVLDMRLGNQAINSLNARIAQLGEQICDYGCGLREGRTFRYSLLDNELIFTRVTLSRKIRRKEISHRISKICRLHHSSTSPVAYGAILP